MADLDHWKRIAAAGCLDAACTAVIATIDRDLYREQVVNRLADTMFTLPDRLQRMSSRTLEICGAHRQPPETTR